MVKADSIHERESRDRRLANLLSQLSDRQAAGLAIDIHEVIAEHPELGDELRELWGAVMLAGAVGSHASGNLSADAVNPNVASTVQLPCQFGDYELISELGRGGMGVVYKAIQNTPRRTVALKMLLRGRFASDSDQARFRAEAEAVARLEHPNIIPVYEVGEQDGHIFFSMKYIAGETLAQKLEAGPLDSREAARILATVARAIDFAHGRGVLHRDLKPSNILLDSDSEPHVTDFGLAKQVQGAPNLTRTGAVLGTPAYMSPEQATGDRGEVGPASDIYSLGSILFHAVTGRPPFQGRSAVDVVIMVLEQDPPPVRGVNPDADRDLEMIALRCLQKPADLRYETAGALASDLEAFLNDETVSARSGRLTQVVTRAFRETHHATILKNWGLLWMWHSVALLIICLLTNLLQWLGDQNRLHYFWLWTAGLGTWATVFWALRQRIGPVTFVERQIAHVWAGSMISIALLFPLEYLMGFDVLTLSPMLGLSSGAVFLVKAGILSGRFYIQAGALFASALAMARWPNFSHVIFGVVSAACFFVPGWKYHRRKQKDHERQESEPKPTLS